MNPPRLKLLTACALLLLQSIASAGLVSIAPVRVDLDQATRTGVVEITNPGNKPIGIEVETLKWRQATDGSDVYETTTDVLAFPPIFTIEPGASQLVRIGRMAPALPDREQAYRLYFTELPVSDSTDGEAIGIKMRMRIGVPVFSAPLVPALPELRIVDTRYEEDRMLVSIYNSGNAHVRLSDIFASELIDAERSTPRQYILPGAVQDFEIEIPAGLTVSSIHAVSDELGTTEFDLETGLAIVPADAELASR
ncbi:MAG: fimbrial biogenesis chaperone [Gammaproteobacteria bacterium]